MRNPRAVASGVDMVQIMMVRSLEKAIATILPNAAKGLCIFVYLRPQAVAHH
jgi:hypothetical protein